MDLNTALKQKADLDLVHQIIDSNKDQFHSLKTNLESMNKKVLNIEELHYGNNFKTNIQDNVNAYKQEISTLKSYQDKYRSNFILDHK